jgi:hypothetical protein
MIVMGNYNIQDFEHYVMSQMSLDANFSRSSVSFDINKIALHVCLEVLLLELIR